MWIVISDTTSTAKLRCWRCSASRVCPYYLPGGVCAYAEPINVSMRRLHRFHIYRTVGTLVAFLAIALTVIPKAV